MKMRDFSFIFFCRTCDYSLDCEKPDGCQQCVAALLALWLLLACRCELDLAAALKNETDALFCGVETGCAAEVVGIRRIQ